VTNGGERRRPLVARIAARPGAVARHKIAAEKARHAKIVLLSNQGLTARERTLYPPFLPFGGCVSTRSRDIVVKANR
jgi:hypothetical protein